MTTDAAPAGDETHHLAAGPPRDLVFWQRLTLALMVTVYTGYYFCRSNLSVCMTPIINDLAAQGMDPGTAKVRLGMVVSAGTLGYAFGKFVSGGLADSLGGRGNVLLGMIGSVACTFLFALGGGLPVFTLAWVGNRALQSLGWAGLVKLTSRWFSFSSYAAVMGVVSLSFLFGDAAARALMGALLERGLGWRGVFGVAGASLLGLFVLSVWLLRESPARLGLPEPEADPDNVFADERPEEAGGRVGFWGVFGTLLRNPSFQTVCLLSVGVTLLRETFGTWTPTYFQEELGLKTGAAATRSALFPLCGGVSVILAGWLGDRLGRVGRAAILCVALALVGVTLAALGWGDFRGGAAVPVGLVALVAFLLIGPYSYLAGVISLDFGGKRGSATASGLIDGVGYLGGVLAGESMARVSLRFGWSGAFGVLAAVAWASALVAGVYWAYQLQDRRAAAPAPAP